MHYFCAQRKEANALHCAINIAMFSLRYPSSIYTYI